MLDKFVRSATAGIILPRAKKLAAEELRSHLEDKIATLEEAGFNRAEAEKKAVSEMGDPKRLSYQFAKTYFPKLTAVLTISVLGIILLFSAGISLYSNHQSHLFLEHRDQIAAKAHQQVVDDLMAVEGTSFFYPSAQHRDAGLYLNSRLERGKEDKEIDLDSLLAFDYWDIGVKAPFPNTLFFVDYVKNKLQAQSSGTLHTLKLYRHIAHLFYSAETTLTSLNSVYLLEEERKKYADAVKMGSIRSSEWQPIEQSILDSARRVFRGGNAYYGIFASEGEIPHREQWCAFVGQATVTASRVRALVEEHFPFEMDYGQKLGDIDQLLQASQPFCRLKYARALWNQSKVETLNELFSPPTFKERSLWLLMQYGTKIPYVRHVVAKYFALKYGGTWLWDYELIYAKR